MIGVVAVGSVGVRKTLSMGVPFSGGGGVVTVTMRGVDSSVVPEGVDARAVS